MKYVICCVEHGLRSFYTARAVGRFLYTATSTSSILDSAAVKRYSTRERAEEVAFVLAVKRPEASYSVMTVQDAKKAEAAFLKKRKEVMQRSPQSRVASHERRHNL